jgi:hypothetical protein
MVNGEADEMVAFCLFCLYVINSQPEVTPL